MGSSFYTLAGTREGRQIIMANKLIAWALAKLSPPEPELPPCFREGDAQPEPVVVAPAKPKRTRRSVKDRLIAELQEELRRESALVVQLEAKNRQLHVRDESQALKQMAAENAQLKLLRDDREQLRLAKERAKAHISGLQRDLAAATARAEAAEDALRSHAAQELAEKKASLRSDMELAAWPLPRH